MEPESILHGFLLPLLTALIVAFLVVEWFVERKKDKIAIYLTLAERELNNLLSSGLEHGGRKGKVAERIEWAKVFLPPPEAAAGGIPALGGITYGGTSSAEATRNIALEIIAANEKDLNGKGAAMGKASITAFLLREIYEGNIDAAQSKIFSDTLNNNGTPPFIAPGIYEIVGFEEFDPETGFPPKCGVSEHLLRRVVRERRFPRDIQIVKTDASGTRFRITGFDVLRDLTQQKV